MSGVGCQNSRPQMKLPAQSTYKIWPYVAVGSAIVPTDFGGHGGPPYISKIRGFTGGA
ncbi:hypothetical protein D1AOALGA4SA_7625 [Olavius algarvensis Delta 1 endosymbiont]|nr:hypothetical protein D1AOALGA4SA_7625 [Olavius algarvensis Delta 1 endosymbiont]